MVRFLTTLPLVALGLAACQSNSSAPPAPAPASVRPAVQTAPADLQLLCASEASTRFGVPADKVLPVSSASTTPGVYQVDLNLGSGQATCSVDANGSILSLNRV